jgi:hypothetical protein
MRLAAAAVTLMLLTGTAYGQINLWADDGKAKDPEAQAKQDEIDKAYKAKIQGQKPAQAPVNDPWGSVRSSSQPASGQSKQQSNSKPR